MGFPRSQHIYYVYFDLLHRFSQFDSDHLNHLNMQTHSEINETDGMLNSFLINMPVIGNNKNGVLKILQITNACTYLGSASVNLFLEQRPKKKKKRKRYKA